MTRLTWTERKHYNGVDRGVLYSQDGSVEVWNGLTTVTQSPEDIRERVRYRDGIKTVSHRSEDSYSASIECFTYPDMLLDRRRPLNFTYRTQTNKGYEIHLVYNALFQTPAGNYTQRDPSPFSISAWTKPNPMPMQFAPTAHVIVDSTLTYSGALTAFETLLYGDELQEPRLPLPEELVDLFDINALYQVIDNGDGTFTLDAPDEVFEWLSATEFSADWPNAVYLDSDTYVVRNW